MYNYVYQYMYIMRWSMCIKISNYSLKADMFAKSITKCLRMQTRTHTRQYLSDHHIRNTSYSSFFMHASNHKGYLVLV